MVAGHQEALCSPAGLARILETTLPFANPGRDALCCPDHRRTQRGAPDQRRRRHDCPARELRFPACTRPCAARTSGSATEPWPTGPASRTLSSSARTGSTCCPAEPPAPGPARRAHRQPPQCTRSRCCARRHRNPGTVGPWQDPTTAVRAIDRLHDCRPEHWAIRLVRRRCSCSVAHPLFVKLPTSTRRAQVYLTNGSASRAIAAIPTIMTSTIRKCRCSVVGGLRRGTRSWPSRWGLPSGTSGPSVVMLKR